MDDLSWAPVPRPPEPPIGARPPQTAAPGHPYCFAEGYGGETTEQVLAEVRNVIAYEWSRSAAGSPVPPFSPEQQEQFLDELLTAMATGHVIPGFYLTEEGCVMEWGDLACFGRWYGQLTGQGRAVALTELASGNPFPWIRTGGQPSPAPAPSHCVDGMSEQEHAYCCPSDVWGDPRYDVPIGQFPQQVKSSSWAKTALLTVAAVGVVLAAGLVISRQG
jgi:hypothetical protein